MSVDFGRVGVLYGGKSAEREVSLMSGQGVHEALRSKGIDAHLFDMGAETLSSLAEQKFDRVFINLHGRFGEDGTLQGALEWLGIPYTGSGVMASSLAMDKVMSKRIWQQHGLPTPDFVELRDAALIAASVEQLGLPLIMKPPHEGSTVGVTRVDLAEQAEAAFTTAMHYDTSVLAEQFIRGRELTVPVLGAGEQARALPVIEIVAPGGNYDFEHKYLSDATQYFCPAALGDELSEQIRRLAVQAYVALGCEGWGRADFMLDEQGQPWLLEMNTSPGMTSHSLVPMGAKADGLSYADLCVEILASARCKVQAIARTV
ncbi:D-alanine--D-alanine ligase [Alcaligenes endophyticus]|uniref:D-alanine--D-alanine ligase n=1 Tax=Alcaligenes endophyticus TaxID=1929088 RepID=A0ABT8EMK6_9BURK|nr:D-alanine--D-alanine ligase [Alcaligenes endophyticus]MCX5591578.1 D-alanine--D-alanine ligase [Alcaligenes endophyticus]MDN4122541.1 D-alanine--D-alanine ligase [Alcaligenes endophyticus]